jgi:hypothetical protein
MDVLLLYTVIYYFIIVLFYFNAFCEYCFPQFSDPGGGEDY